MKRIKEDMVAGPYNPDRRLSFGDEIEAELSAIPARKIKRVKRKKG